MVVCYHTENITLLLFHAKCSKILDSFEGNFVKLEENIFVFDKMSLKFDKIWLIFHNYENCNLLDSSVHVLIDLKILGTNFSIKKYNTGQIS